MISRGQMSTGADLVWKLSTAISSGSHKEGPVVRRHGLPVAAGQAASASTSSSYDV